MQKLQFAYSRSTMLHFPTSTIELFNVGVFPTDNTSSI
jgi:hypothetical protein